MKDGLISSEPGVPNDHCPSSLQEDEAPECFPRLSTVGREKTKGLFIPLEIKEKDEKLHTQFAQNKGEVLDAAAASQTALNGGTAL